MIIIYYTKDVSIITIPFYILLLKIYSNLVDM